jgi:hypothetical protein
MPVFCGAWTLFDEVVALVAGGASFAVKAL